MSRTLRIAAAILTAGVATLLLLHPTAPLRAQPPGTMPPVVVKVGEAVEKPLNSTLWVPGTVVSRHDARIAAEIAGRLEWVAEIGDEVARGKMLARIDDKTLQLALREAETRIQRLAVNLNYLERQESRLETLEAEQIAARNQLDEIVSRREMAQQELAEAHLARDQVSERLTRTQVKAPFPGQIVERMQQLGEYTSVGSTLVRLVDVRHTEIRALAPLNVAPFVKRGMTVAVKESEEETPGRIRAVIPVGDEVSRMFEIRVELSEESGSKAPPWAIGAALRVALPQHHRRSAIAVPRDALILRQDSTYVFKVTATGTVDRIDVTTGSSEGSWIEVRGDIVAGDRVVVRGGERLQPGQTVVIQ